MTSARFPFRSLLLSTALSTFIGGCGGLLLFPSSATQQQCKSSSECGIGLLCGTSGTCEKSEGPCSALFPEGDCSSGRECTAGICECTAEDPTVCGCPASGCTPVEEDYCDCDASQGCNDEGECLDITTENACSPSNPDGLCIVGQICAGGACVPIDSSPCASDNITGFCDPGLVCDRGFCIPIADLPCDATTGDGNCPASQECNVGAGCEVAVCSATFPSGACDPGQVCQEGSCTGLPCSLSVPDGVCEEAETFCSVIGSCIPDDTCRETPDCPSIATKYCASSQVCETRNTCREDVDCELQGKTGNSCTTAGTGAVGSCVPNTSCEEPSDCADGQFCSSGGLCRDPGECDAAADCTTVSGKPECSVTGDCMEVDSCRATGDCSGAEFCALDVVPAPSCLLDPQCSPGFGCSPGFSCDSVDGTSNIGSCVSDAPPCSSNDFQPSHCTLDSELLCCAPGETCCETAGTVCSIDPSGIDFCIQLGTQCRFDSDCPPGHECGGSESCVPEAGNTCTSQANCAANERCASSGGCLPLANCFTDSDCFSGEYCGPSFECLPNPACDFDKPSGGTTVPPSLLVVLDRSGSMHWCAGDLIDTVMDANTLDCGHLSYTGGADGLDYTPPAASVVGDVNVNGTDYAFTPFFTFDASAAGDNCPAWANEIAMPSLTGRLTGPGTYTCSTGTDLDICVGDTACDCDSVSTTEHLCASSDCGGGEMCGNQGGYCVPDGACVSHLDCPNGQVCAADFTCIDARSRWDEALDAIDLLFEPSPVGLSGQAEFGLTMFPKPCTQACQAGAGDGTFHDCGSVPNRSPKSVGMAGVAFGCDVRVNQSVNCETGCYGEDDCNDLDEVFGGNEFSAPFSLTLSDAGVSSTTLPVSTEAWFDSVLGMSVGAEDRTTSSPDITNNTMSGTVRYQSPGGGTPAGGTLRNVLANKATAFQGPENSPKGVLFITDGDANNDFAALSNICLPNCSGGGRDGSESDVNCGGLCGPCADGLQCTVDDDCASRTCRLGECIPATCSDGVENGSESDVDCGGGACPGCGGDLACASDGDCLSGDCDGVLCTTATCSDGESNGFETGVDCGGSQCATCANGQECRNDDDCVSGFCDGSLSGGSDDDVGQCAASYADQCNDGLLNGDELKRDCGGSCDSCDGANCASNGDCASNRCNNYCPSDDGGACTTNFPAANNNYPGRVNMALSQLYADEDELKTYVVGFAFNGGASVSANLNTAAFYGKTDTCGCTDEADCQAETNACYYTANNSAQLVTALKDIAADAATCVFDLSVDSASKRLSYVYMRQVGGGNDGELRRLSEGSAWSANQGSGSTAITAEILGEACSNVFTGDETPVFIYDDDAGGGGTCGGGGG